jgi:hypothetical protein
VVILIETPGYGLYDQIRAGNMGHAAIEIDGKLHDIGSLNGYAYTISASRAVRFWNFADAATALREIAGHPDSDGALPRVTRFDVTVTDAQAARLAVWWEEMEGAIADPGNRLYFWNGWQCASAVAASLRDAGVTQLAPSTPTDLCEYLEGNLRNTAGRLAGGRAIVTVVQAGSPGRMVSAAEGAMGLVMHSSRMLSAGERTPLTVLTPEGTREAVLWSDGKAYAEAVKGFSVSPEAAAKRLHEKNPQSMAGAIPNFIVGHWYHFPSDHVIGQAALSGAYVNGEAGEIREIESAEVIRFDLFKGDAIVRAGR